MLKVINFVKPALDIQKLLTEEYICSIPYSKILISDSPKPFSDLLVFNAKDFSSFKDFHELNFIPYILYGSTELIHRSFSQGASDFLKLPFETDEFEARAFRIIQKDSFTINSVSVHYSNVSIYSDFKTLPFNDKEYSILSLLINNKDRTVSRESLIYRLGMKEDSTRVIDVYINAMRKKIGQILENEVLGKNCIKTIRGVGYRINPQIHCG